MSDFNMSYYGILASFLEDRFGNDFNGGAYWGDEENGLGVSLVSTLDELADIFTDYTERCGYADECANDNWRICELEAVWEDFSAGFGEFDDDIDSMDEVQLRESGAVDVMSDETYDYFVSIGRLTNPTEIAIEAASSVWDKLGFDDCVVCVYCDEGYIDKDDAKAWGPIGDGDIANIPETADAFGEWFALYLEHTPQGEDYLDKPLYIKDSDNMDRLYQAFNAQCVQVVPEEAGYNYARGQWFSLGFDNPGTVIELTHDPDGADRDDRWNYAQDVYEVDNADDFAAYFTDFLWDWCGSVNWDGTQHDWINDTLENKFAAFKMNIRATLNF